MTAQLIHAATDRHLWARSYDRELRDVLALQGEVATGDRAGGTGRGPARRASPAFADDHGTGGGLRRRTSRAGTTGRCAGGRTWRRRPGTSGSRSPRIRRTRPPFRGCPTPIANRRPWAWPLPAPTCRRPRRRRERPSLWTTSLAEAHASLAGVLYRYRWDWKGADEAFRRSPGPRPQLRRSASRVRDLPPHDASQFGRPRRGSARGRAEPALSDHRGGGGDGRRSGGPRRSRT